MSFINFNGKLIEQGIPVVKSDNRGLRYGDGLFETMRMEKGIIRNWDLHMDRLFAGLSSLKFTPSKLFKAEYLLAEIQNLALKNRVTKQARIRLMIIRGSGGLFDPENLHSNFIIEATELPEQYFRFNENGLVIDVFPEARKAVDAYSNLKHNNYLPYAMGAIWAKEHRLNDCLLLNQYDHICDSTIANIFLIKNATIFTPPLSEAPVAGTMRRFLLEQLKAKGYSVEETTIGINELLEADEIFLTNAAYGLRWVASFRNKSYQSQMTAKIYRQFIQTNE